MNSFSSRNYFRRTLVIRVTASLKKCRLDVARGRSRLGLSTTSSSSCERSFTLESEKRLVSKKRFIDFYFKFCPACDLFPNVRAIIAILRTAIFIDVFVLWSTGIYERNRNRQPDEISKLKTSNFSLSKYCDVFGTFDAVFVCIFFFFNLISDF